MKFIKCLFYGHKYRLWQNKSVRECSHCGKIQELDLNTLKWINWKQFN